MRMIKCIMRYVSILGIVIIDWKIMRRLLSGLVWSFKGGKSNSKDRNLTIWVVAMLFLIKKDLVLTSILKPSKFILSSRRSIAPICWITWERSMLNLAWLMLLRNIIGNLSRKERLNPHKVIICFIVHTCNWGTAKKQQKN